MDVARIIVQGVTADVYSPFEARDIMRSIPDRKWNKRGKCWVIDTVYVDLCADSLRAFGCTVYVTTHTGHPWTGGRPGVAHGRRNQPAPNWIGEAFAAVPAENVPKLRRALMGAFHPDAGGDAAIAVQINQAADKRENP